MTSHRGMVTQAFSTLSGCCGRMRCQSYPDQTEWSRRPASRLHPRSNTLRSRPRWLTDLVSQVQFPAILRYERCARYPHHSLQFWLLACRHLREVQFVRTDRRSFYFFVALRAASIRFFLIQELSQLLTGSMMISSASECPCIDNPFGYQQARTDYPVIVRRGTGQVGHGSADTDAINCDRAAIVDLNQSCDAAFRF